METVPTTTVKGILLTPTAEPAKKQTLVIQVEYHNGGKGPQSKITTNSNGAYDFKLKEGKYSVYLVKDEDSYEVYMGSIIVYPEHLTKTYTLEQLLNN